MKKLFYLFPLLALLVACQPDDSVAELGYISFSNQQVEELTRGDNTLTTANLVNFDVWGHNDDGVVFTGTKVEKQGDAWSCTEQKKWEHSTTYHFHSFAPSGLIVNVGEYPNAERVRGLSNFTYTNEGDKDLVYAYATRTQGSPRKINSDPVQLVFEHLLSRVQFTFKNNLTEGDITITDVQITDVIKSAELNCVDVSIANWAWTETSTGNYNFGNTDVIVKGESKATSNVQFMFPAATQNYNITFKFQYESDAVEEKTATISDVTLVMGKSYNVNVTIADKDIVAQEYNIDFFVTEVNGWGNNEELDATMSENLGSSETLGVENGYAYVDLGLSVKWATCNIGAEKPEDYGDYFAWGETDTKERYDWNWYIYGKGPNAIEKYCSLGELNTENNNFADNKEILEPQDDVATVKWGGKWRMPTFDEISELKRNCTCTWIEENGVRGCKILSSNGNSIFLPAAGYNDKEVLIEEGESCYFWSSRGGTDYPGFANYLRFSSEGDYWNSPHRCYGLSIRPVCP